MCMDVVHMYSLMYLDISSVTQELSVDVTGLELSPAAAQCAVLRLEQLAVNKVSGRWPVGVAFTSMHPCNGYGLHKSEIGCL